MNAGDLGLLLQGIGALALAATTLVVGLRAAKALSIRIEGPVHVSAARESRRLKPGLDKP